MSVYVAATAVAVAMKHLNEPVPSIRSRRPDVPVALEATIMHALAKDPAKRFGSAREMDAALAQTGLDTRAASDDFTPACGTPGGHAGDAVYHLSASEPEEVVVGLSATFDAALELTSAPCGSFTIAKRPVPGMSAGPTITVPPCSLALDADASTLVTWK